MLVIPDVDKWKADKEFYNKGYLEYLKHRWTMEEKMCRKLFLRVKKEETKEKHEKWINICLENLSKIDQVMKDLK